MQPGPARPLASPAEPPWEAVLDFALDGYSVIVQARAREAAIELIGPAVRSVPPRTGPDLLRRLGERGLLAITIPRRLDGEAQGLLPMTLVYEELARADALVHAAVAAQVGLVSRSLLDWGTAEQVDRWVRPLARGEVIGCFATADPEARADGHLLPAVATREGGGFLLEGVKRSVVNGAVAGLAIVVAAAPEGLTAFLVPSGTEGLSALPEPGEEADRPGAAALLSLDRVLVPPSAVLGEVGGGLNVVAAAQRHGRLAAAAGAVGIIQACADLAADAVRGRGQSGGAGEVALAALGEIAAAAAAARLIVREAAWLGDTGDDSAAAVAAAKLVACEAAIRSADAVALLADDLTSATSSAAEALRRSARALQLRDGGPHRQRLVVAQYLVD